ncbi:hypothetical protein L1887_32234 [Cichorium endivia]|nr:hypothetical protein L1887_32234 [Cichorium endivia]
MLFIAKNDNIAEIKYRDSTFNIMYRGVPLGRGTVPGFYQAVSVDRMSLLQADVAELVRMDRVSLSATPAFQKEWIGQNFTDPNDRPILHLVLEFPLKKNGITPFCNIRLSKRMDRVESFSLGHCVDVRLLLALCFTSILVKPPHAFLLIYANFWGCMWCYRAPAPHLNDFLGLDHQVNDRFSCGAIVPSE